LPLSDDRTPPLALVVVRRLAEELVLEFGQPLGRRRHVERRVRQWPRRDLTEGIGTNDRHFISSWCE